MICLLGTLMEAMEVHSVVTAVLMEHMEIILWDGVVHLGCLIRAVLLGGETMVTKICQSMQLSSLKPAQSTTS